MYFDWVRINREETSVLESKSVASPAKYLDDRLPQFSQYDFSLF